ncbi:MAG: transposase [Chloroflexi bacterium]|nr:transposase [Chloroflexota bacterium]
MARRKQRSAEFKFKVALEAAKGTKTLNELSSEYEVHTTQISEWKNQLLKDGANLFSTATVRQQRDKEAQQAELYEQIGRLKMELEWLKKTIVAKLARQWRQGSYTVGKHGWGARYGQENKRPGGDSRADPGMCAARVPSVWRSHVGGL